VDASVSSRGSVVEIAGVSITVDGGGDLPVGVDTYSACVLSSNGNGPIGFVAAVACVVILAACQGSHSRPASAAPASYAACATGGAAAACLRFLDREVGVSSMRLTAHVPPQVDTTCAVMARMTDLRVICPPLVPAGGVVSDRDLYGPQIVDHRSYSMSINNGQNRGRVHWEIGATTAPARALWIFDRSDWDAMPPKRPARLVGERQYLGHVVRLYRFPNSDGQLEGHDAALASVHRVTYFVSIHGHSHDDADMAMLLAILARS
jgi:hypothetical protein